MSLRVSSSLLSLDKVVGTDTAAAGSHWRGTTIRVGLRVALIIDEKVIIATLGVGRHVCGDGSCQSSSRPSSSLLDFMVLCCDAYVFGQGSDGRSGNPHVHGRRPVGCDCGKSYALKD